MEMSDRSIWDKEYSSLKVIPSSSRKEPSKALKLVSALLPIKGRVLEPGCGNSRNSIYLAKLGCDVFAIDYSTKALAHLTERAKMEKVLNKIHIYNHSVLDPLPFQDDFFDYIFDIYTFCHFLDEQERTKYFRELSRVAGKNAFLVFVGFSVNDEYYSQMAYKKNEDVWIIIDPNNLIQKNLYIETGISKLLKKNFKLIHLIKHEFFDSVLGKEYKRSIFTLIMKPLRGAIKNSHY